MSPTITLKGAVKFSVKKLLAGGEMTSSNYTGPGEILFAPATLGDISVLRLNGTDVWNVGKDAFFAATQGVTKEVKSQGFSKAMFSGEGMFVYKISGNGIMWISSFGAIVRKDVSRRTSTIIIIIVIPSGHASGDGKIKGTKLLTPVLLVTPPSSSKANATSSTTVIWSPGTASTFWSASPRAASSPAWPQPRAWSASSPDPAPCTCRRATRRPLWPGRLPKRHPPDLLSPSFPLLCFKEALESLPTRLMAVICRTWAQSG
jgi:hypothetical protein